MNGVRLETSQLTLTVDVLESHLVRVRAVQKPNAQHASSSLPLEETRSWSVVDASGDVPWSGRSREDLSRFSRRPAAEIVEEDAAGVVLVKTPELIVRVTRCEQDLSLSFASATTGDIFLSDVARDAYVYHGARRSFRHTVVRADEDECLYGFGETSGRLNKQGRRLRVDATDAMGYDAATSDPLYKHAPYYVGLTRGVAYSVLYDTMRRGVFDLGQEISAWRGPYRYFEQEASSSIEYYVALGPDFPRVSRALLQLLGAPLAPPAYALGYLGSSMAYAESGQAEVSRFLQKCKQHEIPCDGFYLSSGYTMDEAARRCVFTWNHRTYPNPRAMFEEFTASKVAVIANVKPWLLSAHPEFQRVASLRGFVRDAQGRPSAGRFWRGGAGTSDAGSYLDFTNPSTRRWWMDSLKSQLLEFGAKAIWNDNNEYEIDDGETSFVCQDRLSVDASGRALQALLMAKASLEALREHDANERRPLVVSRSGSLGTHRYASQTWSGDNSTSWETLRYNVPMCLGLGLCGWVGNGPDVGGFAGRRPSERLFLRWVQLGIWMPRFSIHSSCWKTSDSGSVTDDATNAPWMFPGPTTAAVRRAVAWRHALKPWLLALYGEASATGAPVARPLVYHYQNDPAVRQESFRFLLGANLFVVPVASAEDDAAEAVRDVYFPGRAERHAWIDLEAGGAVVEGGARIPRLDLKDRPRFGLPVFLRVGTGFVLEESEGQRTILLARSEDAASTVTWSELDGSVWSARLEPTRGARAEIAIRGETRVRPASVRALSAGRAEWTELPFVVVHQNQSYM